MRRTARAWRCGVCTRRDGTKRQPAKQETSRKDIYPDSVKGKKKEKKKDPGCPKHHNDDGSRGTGSLFSTEVGYNQIVGCQHTEVSLLQDTVSLLIP